MTHPDSSVIDRDMLDDEFAVNFSKPWLHILPDGTVSEYASEDEACAAQRIYRIAAGLDPMTGEPATY